MRKESECLVVKGHQMEGILRNCVGEDDNCGRAKEGDL